MHVLTGLTEHTIEYRFGNQRWPSDFHGCAPSPVETHTYDFSNWFNCLSITHDMCACSGIKLPNKLKYAMMMFMIQCFFFICVSNDLASPLTLKRMWYLGAI